MKVIIFDTETTGLLLPSGAPIEKQPRIIELGIVVVQDGHIAHKKNWMLNPGQQISAEITKITGITNDDLADKLPFKDHLTEIEHYFSGSDFGVCHNAPFDTGMLKTELQLLGHTTFPWPDAMICTAQEYAAVLGFRPSLKVLYKNIIGVDLEQTHRASDDAYAVYEILKKDNSLPDFKFV